MSNFGEVLRGMVERIERLEQEKKDITSDLKDLYCEAQSKNINKKALKQIIKIRKKSKKEREEQEDIIKYYLDILD